MSKNQHCKCYTVYNHYLKISNLRKEVGIAVKSKEASNQLEPVRNSYVAIMHQPVTVSSTMQPCACTNKYSIL